MRHSVLRDLVTLDAAVDRVLEEAGQGEPVRAFWTRTFDNPETIDTLLRTILPTPEVLFFAVDIYPSFLHTFLVSYLHKIN